MHPSGRREVGCCYARHSAAVPRARAAGDCNARMIRKPHGLSLAIDADYCFRRASRQCLATHAVARIARPDGVDRSAEPAGVAVCEEEWRYGALQERVLDDDAAGCTNEVGVSHHTSGHAAGDRSPVSDNVLSSGSGIESLIRPGGRRRLRRFAGRTDSSKVAFRGITPDPAPAIQAGTGSGVDAGPVRGLAQSTKTDLLNVGRQSRQVVARRTCNEGETGKECLLNRP